MNYKIEIGEFNSGRDVVVTLPDGRVVNISPDFDVINVFADRAEFERFDVGSFTVLHLPARAELLHCGIGDDDSPLG